MEDLNAIWQQTCEKVKQHKSVDVTQLDAIFSRLQPQAFSVGYLMITADNPFIKKWVEEHYVSMIAAALEEIYNTAFTVAVEVDSTAPAPAIGNPTQAPETSVPAPVAETASPEPKPEPAVEANKDPEESDTKPESAPNSFSFDNFITGNSNRMAYSMALSVAETPGKVQLNPLFIYGKPGLGKTHLMRAIQGYINDKYPTMKTVFVDTMAMVDEFAESSIKNNYESFKRRYESADVLLIDDVQYLRNKPGTLDILFQIFNQMMNASKQVVLSADRSPINIDIDERYQSRFSQGGTFDIQAPEIETKLGIIRSWVSQCAEEFGRKDIKLPDEIELYIAENSSSNIRELKGCISSLIVQIIQEDMNDPTGEGTERDLDDYRKLADKHLSGSAQKRITVADIQGIVESYYHISHSDLIGKKRTHHIAHIRQIAIYLCRMMIDISHDAIGKDFGSRDHTTIIYSIKVIETELVENRETKEEVEVLRQMINDL